MNREKLSSLFLVLALAGCSGRSSLNDFTNGATDIIQVRPSNGNGAAPSDASTDDASPDAAMVKSGEVGDACESAEDCKGRASTCLQTVEVIPNIFEIEYPGGYCAKTGCQDNSDCGDGSGCVQSFGSATCVKKCKKDNDCRVDEGYTCRANNGGFGGGMNPPKYCLPPTGMMSTNTSGGSSGGSTRGSGGTSGGSTRGTSGGSSGGITRGSSGGSGGQDVGQICTILCQNLLDQIVCRQALSMNNFQGIPKSCTGSGMNTGGR